LAYQTVKESHIRVLWPRDLADPHAVVKEGLWHVCPAHVYEARVSALGQVQVVVNYENCIKCETCWRTSEVVDWGRDGKHRFIYPVQSPVPPRLLADVHAAGPARPALPRVLDGWEPAARQLAASLGPNWEKAANGRHHEEVAELLRLAAKLE